MAATTTIEDEQQHWERPNDQLIADAYQYLFASSLTAERLRESAASGMLMPEKYHFGEHGLIGRSLAWKIFLTPVPPLTLELSTRPIAPLSEIRRRRAEYVDALKIVMRAPDGNYAPGFTLPGQSRPPTPTQATGEFSRNNPLSLDEQNPWKQWFESVELRKTIQQDVQRTFPDIGFFREPQVQNDLSNVLFLHASKHPDIGYRQGMHELLAAIFLALEYDSLDKWTTSVQNPDIIDMCDRTWVAADAWHLFSTMMEGVSPWYEWREPSNLRPSQMEDGLRPYTTPITSICNRLQNQYLSNVDPTLWRRMSELGIEPQLYGIRWLRLLFTREFTIRQAMILWDGLLAVDTSMHLAYWICVAMLVRIRNKLIPAEYTEQLSLLLRYPTQPGDGALSVSLLLQQAVRLSQDPNTSTGASIVLQNRNVLGIPIEVPEAPPAENARRRRGHAGNQNTGSIEKREASLGGFSEMLARNILDKGESLGINRAIASTVSELRKNLPDLPTTLRTGVSPQYTNFPSYQAKEFGSNATQSPWMPESISADQELGALRTQQKRLSRAMTWAVDVLLQGSDATEFQHRDAVECLAYVRDVLMVGNVTRLDEDRLSQHQPSPSVDYVSARPNVAERSRDEPASPSPLATPPVMLSRRDATPLTSLTRTPYIRKEIEVAPNAARHTPNSSLANSRSLFTSPTSPLDSRSGGNRPQSTLLSPTASKRPANDRQGSDITLQQDLRRTYSPLSHTSAAPSPSVDPLGVLR